MSPAPLNEPTRAELDKKRTHRAQQRRRKKKLCLLSAKHGAVFKSGRCQACYERALESRKRNYVSRPNRKRSQLPTMVEYMRIRGEVAKVLKQRSGRRDPTDASFRRHRHTLMEATDYRMRKSGWYEVLPVNVPPPGWSVEEDIREEQLANTYAWLAWKGQ